MQKKALSVSLSVSVLCMSLLAANSAFASKARVNALQGALGLVDSQTIFAQPAYVNKLDPYGTFEFGTTSVSGSPRAEGGFLLNNGARWGAYLGHQSDFQNLFRGTTFQKQDNPVDLFYGNGDWAASLSVSNSEDLQADKKQSAVVARFGYLMGTHEFAASIDALGTAENTGGQKLTTTFPGLRLSWLNTMDSVVLSVAAAYGAADSETAGVKTEMKTTGVAVGANHRPFEGVYYGAFVDHSEYDQGGKKITATTLPVVFGLEKDMTSWLVLRGSVKQNLLLGSVKDDITPVKEKKNLNDTTVAAGAGLKFSNFTIDGLLSAASNGKVNGNDFLSHASLTYTF